ncbi:MAG: molybdenum cofactor guanylyltransferase [Acidobacteria bacterium]|nr:molybdenum cofactor guanylyltransferase [Acidobacteriota bacterium]
MNDPDATITVFIQAAGHSSRMGREKARLEVGGLAVIDRVIGAARAMSDSIVIVCKDDAAFNRERISILPDPDPGKGPLHALQLALEASGTDWVLNLACDLPFISGAFLQLLASHASCWQAVVPLDREGQSQPLCALYHRSAIAEVRALLQEGELRIRPVFERVKTRTLPFGRFSHLPNATYFFFDMNTPAHYHEAVRIARMAGT